LLFAISRNFTPAEAEKAFRLCTNWSVRFLIAGGRGGFLDRHYGLRAQEIGTGKISTAKQLLEAMREHVPKDAEFQDRFSRATVSQSYLARYYLKALDAVLRGETEPEWIANPETEVVNLEHVMPKEPGASWKIEPDVAAANLKRIGNMVLLQASKNVGVANQSFEDKKKEYKNSSFLVTKQVARYKQWTPKEIDDRQSKLAPVALDAWPLDLKIPKKKKWNL
jgi:hypothetical protein